MMTRRLVRDDLAAAVAVLQRGGLVAMPTETVYGLAADATDPDAVARVFAAKGRPVDHPLIVHLAEVSDFLKSEVPGSRFAEVEKGVIDDTRVVQAHDDVRLR